MDRSRCILKDRSVPLHEHHFYGDLIFARIAHWRGDYWLGRPLTHQGMYRILEAKHQNAMSSSRMLDVWDDEAAAKTVTFGIWKGHRLLYVLVYFPPDVGSLEPPMTGTGVDFMRTLPLDGAAIAATWGALHLPIEHMPTVGIKGTEHLSRLGPTIFEFNVEAYRLLGMDPWMQEICEFGPWYKGMQGSDP